MKNVTAIVCMSAAVMFLLVSESYTEDEKKPVTPYGDSCDLCSKYGICKSVMSHEQAHRALMKYYHSKGLIVEVDRKNGRFIRAKVREKDKVVDIIIFDRRSGRVRSIY
ncbi:MAG: hypothetical protein JSV11_12360 [Nitrospiraceae bacterium]|nr:MAG: hypothetical protein JSV11_12360 [Nitrospiraceae bacterium]